MRLVLAQATVSNPLHEALVALIKGGDDWYSTAELGSGLNEHGADFIVDADVSGLLRTPPFNTLDEKSNDVGVYIKKYGPVRLLQVRWPGEPPDLTKHGARVDTDAPPEWGMREGVSLAPT